MQRVSGRIAVVMGILLGATTAAATWALMGAITYAPGQGLEAIRSLVRQAVACDLAWYGKTGKE